MLEEPDENPRNPRKRKNPVENPERSNENPRNVAEGT